MREPLSEIARKALDVTRARASRDGLDFFEELNRVGLIATAPRIREIEVAALLNMLERLKSMEPAALLHIHTRGNSNPATAADMLAAVESWIELHIRNID